MTVNRRHLLLGLAGLGLAPTPGQALDRTSLFAVATRLVAIYRAGDADALHRALAPDLQPDFPPTALSAWLQEARDTFGILQRTSLPTYGSRAHSIFVAYFDRGPSDMYLQIDEQERVLFWTFKTPSHVLSLRRRA
jgi:hypothetical protein